ncbi:MAG: Hpt domain-containing protein [Gammaproteobacteria bacterium]|nr:Hpt domain-containing protein [Gammaproteobacteria bacterium]
MNRAVSDPVITDVNGQALKFEILDALRNFIGGDPLAQYLAEFIENTAKNIQRIGIAVAAEDGGRVRHLTHKLKGSSGNIGAFKLAWHCVTLESLSAENISHETLMSQYRELEQVYLETREALQTYIDGLTVCRTSIA